MYDLVEKQGWNEDTMLIFAEEFIAACGLSDKYEAFLQARAYEENSESQGE